MHKRFLLCLASALLLLASPAGLAQDSFGLNKDNNAPLVRSSVLPVDEAFAMSTFIEAPDTIILFWNITQGYYLYQDSITVTDAEGKVINIGELPEATLITDEFFGETQVYLNRLIHRFPLAAIARENNAVTFTLQYQGCAKDLYCYPMQVKEVALPLP